MRINDAVYDIEVDMSRKSTFSFGFPLHHIKFLSFFIGLHLNFHSAYVVHCIMAKDLEAIKLQLGDKPYLFGDAPTAADASICPMLSGLQSIPLPTEVSNLIKSDDILTGYIARMRVALYHLP